jgi:hypothetical protein
MALDVRDRLILVEAQPALRRKGPGWTLSGRGIRARSRIFKGNA